MTTLTDRLAQADKPTRELLLEVWGGCPVCSGDCGSANPPVMFCPTSRYLAMLDAEAWTSAVEMLVPASVDRYPQAYYIGPNPNESRVGHRWELWTKDCRGKPFRGHHINSSSLALAIACLKARGDRMAEIARHASLCNFITGLGDGLCDCGLDQALTEWRDQ